ncbi:hypothetical protein TNCV_3524501 [Trichonephila clavipes]|uniref:Uncharacterized protein n=1 Tax=Trichonephila clavipes TaxID=2585209 RepID=A0A8X6VGL2_TRICX|nr:hypothetical protein TNCV_3524501 [Trichonephila clavipes]
MFAEICCSMRFSLTPSLRPLLETLYFVEARTSALVSSLAKRLSRFPQDVLRFGIGLSSSKNDAADCEISVVTTEDIKERVGGGDGLGIGLESMTSSNFGATHINLNIPVHICSNDII